MLAREPGLRAMRHLLRATAMVLFAAGGVAAQGLRGYDIAAQPLRSALSQLAQQSGLNLAVPTRHTAGLTSTAISGDMSADQALAALLRGTGLTLAILDGTVTLPASAPAADPGGAGDGAVLLDPVVIAGSNGRFAHPGATYDAPASTSYYSAERIQNTRGTAPGDFLRGEAGVLNGDTRNSGAIDVNIRGLQGEGRVATIVDGSVQQQTVWRGYSGVASRVYLDPDLIGEVVIEKGPSDAPDAVGATGGVARISTLRASDILQPGQDRGVRLRFTAIGNLAAVPPVFTLGGQNGDPASYDRPGTLDFGQGFGGSIAVAQRFGNFELVAAVARRQLGNYFGGTNGEGPDDGGLNHFEPGQQVLNTSQNNISRLLRGTYRWGDGHSIDASVMRYGSDYGELMPSQIIRFGGAVQAPLSRVDTDTATLRYRWNPAENDLIDLKADLWATRNTIRIATAYRLCFGTFCGTGYEATMNRNDRFGLNLSNTSRFQSAWGDLDLSYGLSFSKELLREPAEFAQWLIDNGYGSNGYGARMGKKEEYSAFVAAELRPRDWVTINAALRYTTSRAVDHRQIRFQNPVTNAWEWMNFSNADSGLAPILSVMVEPTPGLKAYARYAEAIRTPSGFESTTGFSTQPRIGVPLKAEHSFSREIGLSYQRDGIFGMGGQFQSKLAYFDNKVRDYLTRDGIEQLMTNIPLAQFRGAELSLGYDNGRFFGGLTATKYFKTSFCSDSTGRLQCYAGGNPSSYGMLHVPPEFSATLTLGARLMQDRLQLGARVTHVGNRAASRLETGGYTAMVIWKPYTTVDLFGSYDLTDRVSLDLAIDNVTDRYYMDALNLGLMPSPGRTVRLGLTAKF